MNINGRYICSDCGKEIPESEVNIGSWGEGSFEGEKVVLVPGSMDVASVENSVSEDDDFLTNESVSENNSRETLPVAETETGVVEEDNNQGFYTSENTQISSQIPLNVQKVGVEGSVKEGNIPEELPQAQVKVPVVSQSQPLPNDPNIYRDPIAEDMSQEKEEDGKAISVNADVPEKRSFSRDKKIIITIILTGVILALLLLGGGLFAFFALTKEVNNTKVQTSEDNVNQENINVDSGITNNEINNNIGSSQTETSNSVDSAQ